LTNGYQQLREEVVSASLSTAKFGELNLSTVPYTADRSLIRHGCVMTLLGLASGLTTGSVKAPTAALEAHTIGVLQGSLLFGLAAIWPSLGTSPRLIRVAKYCAIIGLYGNWIGSQLAAFWSARALFSVTRKSMPAGAAPWMEAVVAVLLFLSFLIIAMCVLIFIAAREPAKR
jgi:hypothetical protein